MRRGGKVKQADRVRKTPKPKGCTTPNLSIADLQKQVAALTQELKEAREQRTATSEVLSAISSSAGELQPVFETMLAKATELCEASYGTMWLCEGDAFRAAAIHGAMPDAFLELYRTGNLYRAGPGAPAYEAIVKRQTCAVADLRETQGYREGSELPVAAADKGGVRTMVAVPMFKEKGTGRRLLHLSARGAAIQR
jgi:hypothetical protein